MYFVLLNDFASENVMRERHQNTKFLKNDMYTDDGGLAGNVDEEPLPRKLFRGQYLPNCDGYLEHV